MNVLRIVVDEIPDKCGLCDYTKDALWDDRTFCIFTNKAIDNLFKRPTWCPLVVDVPEVCEWKYQFFTPQDGEVYERKCSLGYATTEYKNQFVFCPNCGKRIKYVESEE